MKVHAANGDEAGLAPCNCGGRDPFGFRYNGVECCLTCGGWLGPTLGEASVSMLREIVVKRGGMFSTTKNRIVTLAMPEQSFLKLMADLLVSKHLPSEGVVQRLKEMADA